MAFNLPPFKWPLDQRQWEDVYRKITDAAAFIWNQIDKTGANLTDIPNRNHADLQNINTSTYTHLSATNHTDLTDGGASTLHYHTSDRDRANHTGTQAASTISDFTEVAEDVTGAMVTGNTETGIAVTYDDTTGKLNFDAQTAGDARYVQKNANITPATKTKLTYDAKGLVTGGADATTADIADSANRRYVTDAQLVIIGNTSGTNTGDVTIGTANGLSLVGQALSLQTATDSVPGALSAADHTSYSGHVASTSNPHGTTLQQAAAAGSTITSNVTFTGRAILPMGEVSYFDMTGASVTIAAQSDGSTNMVVAAPTTSLSVDTGFDNGGANNGRLRYTGVTTKMFHAACTISIAPAAANDTFVFGIAKNGTVISSSKVLMQAINASAMKSTAMHVMVQLATNDYLELYVGNTTDADDCTVHSLNLFAVGM